MSTKIHEWFDPQTLQPLEQGDPAYPGHVCVTDEGPCIVTDIDNSMGRPNITIKPLCLATSERLLNVIN